MPYCFDIQEHNPFLIYGCLLNLFGTSRKLKDVISGGFRATTWHICSGVIPHCYKAKAKEF
jgi:hypothetical protein